MDSDYNVVKTWFGRTVIRSSYKLFYEVNCIMFELYFMIGSACCIFLTHLIRIKIILFVVAEYILALTSSCKNTTENVFNFCTQVY